MEKVTKKTAKKDQRKSARKTKLTDAVELLGKALKKDKGLRSTWTEYISLQFIETEKAYRKMTHNRNRLKGPELEAISIVAADSFINILCGD